MNKILIIDDDRELCALIKRSVQSEHIEADFCNTGKEGLQKLKEQEYQLVVLDVMMPGMDGFETLEEIRKENSLPILMFTSKNDSASKVRGLRAGADDYLVKPFAVAELLARLNALVRRQGSYMEENVEYKGFVLNSGDYTISYGGSKVQLRPREFKLIELLLRNAGKIIPRDVILERVWGIESDITENNLDVHIGALRRKLKEIKGETLIKTIRGVGYLAEADDNVR